MKLTINSLYFFALSFTKQNKYYIIISFLLLHYQDLIISSTVSIHWFNYHLDIISLDRMFDYT